MTDAVNDAVTGAVTGAAINKRTLLQRGGLWAAMLGCGGLDTALAAAPSSELLMDVGAFADALRATGGELASSADIALRVPPLAENGAFVPVTVSSALAGTQEISIVVATNPNPMVVRFTIPDGTEPFVSTRVKVASSGRVYALVKADEKLYATFADTQVTVGGCG